MFSIYGGGAAGDVAHVENNVTPRAGFPVIKISASSREIDGSIVDFKEGGGVRRRRRNYLII